jgi:hypothetical protein
MLPYIIFLDIDKTVIGRAHSVVERFFLRKVIAEVGAAGELDARKVVPLDPAAEMAPLLRPGFGDAIRRIKKALGGHVELFVCTMGVPSTVMELKAPGIECSAGVRFNRPLFHRGICQSSASPDKKLVGACFKVAAAALARRKYPALRDPAAVHRTFHERFFMVDDLSDVAFDDASNKRMLVCPPYEHHPWSDPLEGVPASVLRSPKVALYVKERVGGWGQQKTPDGGNADDFWPSFATMVERAAATAVGRQPVDVLGIVKRGIRKTVKSA